MVSDHCKNLNPQLPCYWISFNITVMQRRDFGDNFFWLPYCKLELIRLFVCGLMGSCVRVIAHLCFNSERRRLQTASLTERNATTAVRLKFHSRLRRQAARDANWMTRLFVSLFDCICASFTQLVKVDLRSVPWNRDPFVFSIIFPNVSLIFILKIYITVFATNFSNMLHCYYLLNYKIWGTLQNQNRGHPQSMITHCGWMGWALFCHAHPFIFLKLGWTGSTWLTRLGRCWPIAAK